MFPFPLYIPLQFLFSKKKKNFSKNIGKGEVQKFLKHEPLMCKILALISSKPEPKKAKQLVLTCPKSRPAKKKEESALTSPRPELKRRRESDSNKLKN